MLLPNRHGSTDSYRYGFQGQEKDDEIKGEGNSLNYKYRMHDPRVGRFFAVDPLTSKYPFLTPYQFSSNSTIAAVEIEGLEGEEVRFRQWMRAQGGIQAQAVEAEDEVVRKITKAVIVDMPEAAIDGVTFTATTLFGGMAAGFNYGFTGESKEWHNHVQWGFSWRDGFQQDGYNSGFGNVTPEDGLRLFEGVTVIYGVGELAPALKSIKIPFQKSLSISKNLLKTREDLAKSFYKKAGFDDTRAADHITGINFSKAVQTKTYKKGTVLEQWTYLDDLGNPKLGNYYTLPGSDPTKLGIPLKGRVKTTVELLEDTKFLKSTTNDIEDWTNPGNILNGGEAQLFQKNVKTKIISDK